jgi:hypothetical protein
MQPPERAFGATGDRAGDVQLGRRRGSPGEHEGPQLGVERVEPVDLLLQADDVPTLDPMDGRWSTGGHRQLGLCDEELVLDLPERRGPVGKFGWEDGDGEAELAAQFVERPVGRDAVGVLGNASAPG